MSTDAGMSPPDRPVDAFILFNEHEVVVPEIAQALEELGVSTYLWRRDIEVGARWEEIERQQLEAAGAVAVFLGPAGWGPNHSRLAEAAIELERRIVPILLEGSPPGALIEGGGIFTRLRYLQAPQDWRAALPAIAAALRPVTRQPAISAVVSQLIDGNDEQRERLIGELAGGRIAGGAALVERLAHEITRFGAGQPVRNLQAARTPATLAEIRSWLLSALVWADAEQDTAREVILNHLVAGQEPEPTVRFWILAGLVQRRPSYLSIAGSFVAEDPAVEIRLLGELILSGMDALIDAIRIDLASDALEEEVWPALRVLRVVAAPSLVPDLCGIVETPRYFAVHYDAYYALSHPEVVREAADRLVANRDAATVLDQILNILSNSDQRAARAFARLVAALPQPATGEALTAARLRPEVGEAARTMQRLVRDAGLGGSAELYVAGYNSDENDVTRDDLAIGEDVRTLTAVMLAREVKPPLAIGLFGDWGTGKSFFMQAMKKATEDFTKLGRASETSKFCGDVVSIDFNAWHYADTNLWASLVTHILDALAVHVAGENASAADKMRLLRELDSAKAIVSEVENEQQAAQSQLEASQGKLDELQQQRAEKELALRDLLAANVQSLLANSDVRKELDGVLRDLGIPAGEANVEDLSAAVADASSLAGRIAATGLAVLRAPKPWVLAIGLVSLLVAPAVVAWVLHALRPDLAAAGALIGEVATLATALTISVRNAVAYVAPRYARLAAAKEKLDAELRKRRAEPSEAEKALDAEIAALRSQEQQTAAKLKAAADRVLELQRTIDELAEARSLGRFLQERARSDDYRRHLGLVSTARRDFETLADRLIDPDIQKGQRRVERIVLYIDDLDRCSVEKIMQVLEAVHLLLAFRLFVVVVGVDPRWLSHALSKTYSAFSQSEDGPEGPPPTPQHYLEKIFQIPVNLKPMSMDGYGALVRSLLAPAMAPTPESRTSTPPPPAAEGPASPAGRPSPEALRSGRPPRRGGQRDGETPQETTEPPAPTSAAVYEESLTISAAETDYAERLYGLFSTPRAVKRFSNIYRILKAPIPPERLATYEGSPAAPGDFQVPMLLLALIVGCPDRAKTMFPSLLESCRAGRDPTDELLALASSAPRPFRMALARAVEDSARLRDAALFVHWIPRVARFSFVFGTALAESEVSTRA